MKNRDVAGSPTLRRQVPRFLAAGAFAALVNIAVRYALTPLVGYSASIVIAFVAGLTTAWLLFRAYVFGPSEGSRGAEYLRFTLVNLLALALVWLVSVGLADYVLPAFGVGEIRDTIAHVIGVLSPIALSFVAHRRYSFRRHALRFGESE